MYQTSASASKHQFHVFSHHIEMNERKRRKKIITNRKEKKMKAETIMSRKKQTPKTGSVALDKKRH